MNEGITVLEKVCAYFSRYTASHPRRQWSSFDSYRRENPKCHGNEISSFIKGVGFYDKESNG
jgi:hypothetical protein